MYDHEHHAQETRSMKRSPITIEVSPELRRRIKLAAAQNDLSVGEYLRRILDKIVPDEASITQQEERPVTPEFLEQVYRVRERIIRESGGISLKTRQNESGSSVKNVLVISSNYGNHCETAERSVIQQHQNKDSNNGRHRLTSR